MYLRKIEIENIRSIKHLEWEIPEGKEAGWHVILGDNGSGKTSFLRAVALCLIGPTEAASLRQNFGNWITTGKNQSSIKLRVYFDKTYDETAGKSKEIDIVEVVGELQILPGRHTLFSKPVNSPHIKPTSGWFSASFGPFRRFTGGDKELFKSFPPDSRVLPHLSNFGENVAFWHTLEWLQYLQFKSLEGKTEEKKLLGSIKTFVNQSEFLPYNVKFETVTSDDVVFVDPNGFKLPVEQLSDGYRSVLSLTFELIRQLAIRYGADKVFTKIETGEIIVDVPGVVLIDEADIHLHPSWQRKIGFWFREHFPKMQFIVTTHSPLICQAASQGSIFLLPKPGTDEKGRILVEGEEEFNQLVYGDILDAYSTEGFGQYLTRSDESFEMQQELADLNLKAMDSKLTPKEKKRQKELRSKLPNVSNF